MLCKKGVLKNFPKFTGRHLCQSLFFNKVAGLKQKEIGTIPVIILGVDTRNISRLVIWVLVSAPSKPDKKYFGIAETAFKDLFKNHTKNIPPQKVC